MATRRKMLGQILLAQGLLTEQQLASALQIQQQSQAPLGTVLVRMGICDEMKILTAAAAQYGVMPWNLAKEAPEESARMMVEDGVCRKYQVLPVQKRGDLLILGMRNPHDVEAIAFIKNLTSMRIEPVLVDEGRLTMFLNEAGIRKPKKNEQFDYLVDKALKDFDLDVNADKNNNQKLEQDTRPVVGLVNQVMADAIRLKASDVHIEPRTDRIDVRYRIDGQLVKVRDFPEELLPMLATRIKIMSDLDIVETRNPQDGRMSVELDGITVDVRVSVIPSTHGPRIVMRILDKSFGLRSMNELGFTETNLGLLRMLIDRPYGLFLVTGPTGSGKTTTLYSALGEIRNSTNNVMTVEDPAEYDIDGVNQTQVNDGIGLTFAKQLRAIMRQDPDVVLVGEIRDAETAETAIRAALTGHLVLSTLHCNDAPSAVPRLLDMGIDPYLLSSSLIGVSAQRLVRLLCKDCAQPMKPSDSDKRILESYFGKADVGDIYRSVGCEKCFFTGHAGRTTVTEIMPVAAEVTHLIAQQAPVELLKGAAAGYGYRTMQEDALERVLRGEITLAEAKRVIAFDQLVAAQHPLHLAA